MAAKAEVVSFLKLLDKDIAMCIIAKVGERTYEFESFSDLTRVREIYANFTGDQNELEQEMENAEIEFAYEF